MSDEQVDEAVMDVVGRLLVASDEGVAVEAVTAALAGRRISLARVRQALAALEGITVDGGTVRWEG